MEQISMWPPLGEGEDAEEIKRQAEVFLEYAKKKRNWENAFQKWSDSQWDDDLDDDIIEKMWRARCKG